MDFGPKSTSNINMTKERTVKFHCRIPGSSVIGTPKGVQLLLLYQCLQPTCHLRLKILIGERSELQRRREATHPEATIKLSLKALSFKLMMLSEAMCINLSKIRTLCILLLHRQI